jgi:hypothetical protein
MTSSLTRGLYADLFGSLDRHQGASTAILTAALVAVTVFYAWQNRKMVGEMKKARDATILPKLALDLHALGPTVFDLAIKNVGPGAALDIDVQTDGCQWTSLLLRLAYDGGATSFLRGSRSSCSRLVS